MPSNMQVGQEPTKMINSVFLAIHGNVYGYLSLEFREEEDKVKFLVLESLSRH